MPLNIPHYNLEELLDMVLKDPYYDIGTFKVLLVATVENDSLDDVSLNDTWIKQLELEDKIENMDNELFYVAEVKKPFLDYEVGDNLLIPESYIDQSLTKHSQYEASTTVLDYMFDYNNGVWNTKEDFHADILEYIASKVDMEIEIREVIRYKEEDLETIFSLLKIYYKIDETSANRNAIKNILCSSATKQVVTSRVYNRKIEIYIDPIVSNKIICTVYNKRNRETKEFYF